MDKKLLEELIKKYGSIENFIEMYKNDNVTPEEYVLFNECIDIDSNSFMNENYLRLIKAVFGGKHLGSNDIHFSSSKAVDEALHTIFPRGEEIIRFRFGLDSGKTKTLQETSEYLNIRGVGRVKIRDLEAKALRELRKPVRARTFRIVALKQLKESSYITEEELAKLSELENEIWNSGVILKDNNAEQIDFDYTKLSIISDIMNNIENRSKQDRAQREQDAEREREEYFKNSIYSLNLSSGCHKALRIAGIATLDELKGLTYYELKNSRGIGPRYFDEIIKELSVQNIILQGEDELTIDGEKPSDKVTLITKTNLSGRSSNALRRAGVTKLEQLANYTYDEVKKFEGLGNKSFEEVINMLHEHGIVLKDSGENERKILRSKKIELEMRLKQLEEETRQCKEMLDTYNKLIDGDKTNTEDEAPDFKDE